MAPGARARRGLPPHEEAAPPGVRVEGFEFLERGTVPLGSNKRMTSLTREAHGLIGKDPMDLGVLSLDGEQDRATNAMDGDMESKEELYD